MRVRRTETRLWLKFDRAYGGERSPGERSEPVGEEFRSGGFSVSSSASWYASRASPAVLVGKQHQPPVARPGIAAGVGEQDERHQPGELGGLGQQLAKHGGQVECATETTRFSLPHRVSDRHGPDRGHASSSDYLSV